MCQICAKALKILIKDGIITSDQKEQAWDKAIKEMPLSTLMSILEEALSDEINNIETEFNKTPITEVKQ